MFLWTLYGHLCPRNFIQCETILHGSDKQIIPELKLQGTQIGYTLAWDERVLIMKNYNKIGIQWYVNAINKTTRHDSTHNSVKFLKSVWLCRAYVYQTHKIKLTINVDNFSTLQYITIISNFRTEQQIHSTSRSMVLDSIVTRLPSFFLLIQESEDWLVATLHSNRPCTFRFTSK